MDKFSSPKCKISLSTHGFGTPLSILPLINNVGVPFPPLIIQFGIVAWWEYVG